MAHESNAFRTGRLTATLTLQRAAAADVGNVCGYCGGVSGIADSADRPRPLHACRCGAHKNVISARERIQQQVAG